MRVRIISDSERVTRVLQETTDTCGLFEKVNDSQHISAFFFNYSSTLFWIKFLPNVFLLTPCQQWIR